jgi:pimeloyl-ACP methyl ester carboxylesterase
MHSILRAARPGFVADRRMIWLPGAYHSPEDFLAAGFDAEVARRDLPLDLEFVRIDLDHVGDRSAVERLAHEIVAPARRAGCRRIWLGGISLGGFFALDYAAGEQGPWDGLCLLAPYLGNRLLIGEIADAGGLASWQPGPLAESDEERRIWRFIQARSAGARPVYLGYGRDDRFAAGHTLLASALPAGAVEVATGGHDWPTWSALFRSFLSSRFL